MGTKIKNAENDTEIKKKKILHCQIRTTIMNLTEKAMHQLTIITNMNIITITTMRMTIMIMIVLQP